MMKRNELISKLADKLGTSKTEAGRVLDGVFDTVKDALKSDAAAKIPGFGTFKVKKVEARERRNPATGDTFMAPATKKIVFKAAAELGDAV